MANPHRPRAWHGSICALVAVLGALVAMLTASDFGTDSRGIDLNASLVIWIVTVAGIALLTLTGSHFDQVHPGAGFLEAIVRLLAPVLVLVLGSAWLMNKGIFADNQSTFVVIGVVVALVVLFFRWLFAQQQTAHRGEPAAAIPMVIPTPAAPAVSMFDGPPQWPSAPPTEPSHPVELSPVAPAPQPADLSPPAPQKQRSGKTHRITSGLITLGWIPIGGLLWFAANWCPNDGTAEAVFVTSTIYVFVQLIVNPLAGWFLDRRYGKTGGAMLAIGRSILVALTLMIAVGFLLSLFVPDGASNYCG